MDTTENRRDIRTSVLLVAAAVGLAAGIYLVTYRTLYYQLPVTVLAAGIAAASALSVFVRSRWVGGSIVALAIAVTTLLLLADFYTMQAFLTAIVAAAAGVVMLAVRRSDHQ